jgi:hypothetical protein
MNPQVPAGARRYTCRSYPYPWCLTRAGTVRTLSSPKPAGFDPDMTRMTRARPYLKSIYDSFGGRENFLLSYGLKPYSANDVEEGDRIVQAMLENDSRV